MKFSTSVVGIGLVFILHLVLIATGAYTAFESIDVVMHVLGGFAFGLLAIALIPIGSKNPKWFSWIYIVGLTLAVGLLWEIAEYLLQGIVGPMTLRDTLADFINDLVGALLAALIFLKK